MSIKKEQKPGSSITYYINEEKGTVVAKMPVGALLFNMHQDCIKYGLPLSFTAKKVCYDYPHKNFVGVAKCAPDDTFDVEIGKQVAVSKMLQKYYMTRLRVFQVIADTLDKQLNDCEDFMNYSWLAANRYLEKERDFKG